MDTNPHVQGDYLKIRTVSRPSLYSHVSFAPSSSRRYYTLQRRDDLSSADWTDVTGGIAIPGTGMDQTLEHKTSATRMVYRVMVTVAP